MMNNRKLIVSAVLLFSDVALAAPESETYLCSHEQYSQKRIIELNYIQPGKAVPCAVSYIKGAETNVLWQANSQQGYCEEKLKIFLEKQASWGWKCEKIQ